LLGEHAAAVDHFERAVEFNARLNARPALARTLVAYARALGEGPRSGRLASSRDAQQRAQDLLRDATRIAKSLALRPLTEQARELARA